MVPPKQNKNKKAAKANHTFRRVRDPLVADATSGTPVALTTSTDSNGNGNINIPLCPLGVSGTSATAASNGVVTFTAGPLVAPYCPWLYNQARNFERYRVLSATFIVIGNLGANCVGRISVDSSTDYADTASGITIGTTTGGKVYDMATLATKEIRFPLDVDTTWKKVSNRTNATFLSPATVVAPINSINDLVFSTVYVGIYGAGASTAGVNTALVNYAVEYDVEFRDPISYSVNI